MKTYPMYKVQRITGWEDESGNWKIEDVFASENHEEVMDYWDGCASGLMDYYGEHENQNFGKAKFYRIIESYE